MRLSGIDLLKDSFKKMKEEQLEEWKDNCPYSHNQVEMYECAVNHCIEALENQRHLEEFTLSFFDDLFKLCKRVYKERPDVENFNKYVENLVKKDLGDLD